MTQTDLDKLNTKALNRFEEIKNRLKFDLGTKVVKQVSEQQQVVPITLTQDKIDEMMDGPIRNYPEEQRPQLVAVASEVDFVDKVFGYIGSLELPLNLSMAIALIISGNKTGNKADLQKAIAAIEEGF